MTTYTSTTLKENILTRIYGALKGKIIGMIGADIGLMDHIHFVMEK